MVELTIYDNSDNLLKRTEVEVGKRLVIAIEEAGVDILHLCGSFAKCTTCRVQFVEGEPSRMTEAEIEIFEKRIASGDEELTQPGMRASCQILVENDMKIRVMKRLCTSNMESPGKQPEMYITPQPIWKTKNK